LRRGGAVDGGRLRGESKCRGGLDEPGETGGSLHIGGRLTVIVVPP